MSPFLPPSAISQAETVDGGKNSVLKYYQVNKQFSWILNKYDWLNLQLMNLVECHYFSQVLKLKNVSLKFLGILLKKIFVL